MNIDIMVDLETMGVMPDAAIISIGAVAADLEEMRVIDDFYRVVSLESSFREGGTMDPQTVIWWMKQPEEARNEFIDQPVDDIRNVLSDFRAWIGRLSAMPGQKPILWAKGAAFDFPILSAAYRRIGIQVPWDYRDIRCFRTIEAFYEDLFPPEKDPHKNGQKHNAISDAYFQMETLFRICNKLLK